MEQEQGINDLNFDYEDTTTIQDEEDFVDPRTSSTLSDSDVVSEYLKQKGISDINKIKYEDEYGVEEEKSWDELEGHEKLNILNQLDDDTNLNNDEIMLINAIRQNGMTPQQYLNYVSQSGAQNYANLLSQQQPQQYSIDQYSDDELYLADIISKVGRENVSDDELLQSLNDAKSNTDLYNKQVSALRNEYKKKEDFEIQRQQSEYAEQQRQMYNQFAGTIYNEVANMNDLNGFDLNLTNEDRGDLFNYITGIDSDGKSGFGRALQDPKQLTRMAWFGIYGDKMLSDISDYIKQQITKVRRDSYQKGVEDARNGQVKQSAPTTVYRPSKPKGRELTAEDLF